MPDSLIGKTSHFECEVIGSSPVLAARGFMKEKRKNSLFNWKRHWAYFKYVMRHKKYVYEECRKLDVPILIALLHDWDKFLPDEWIPYAQTFYTPNGEKQYVENDDFTRAWLYHQKRNKHHWQYWMITWDRGETECLPMPDVYRREMLADWRGAGRAINGKDDTLSWFSKQAPKMKLHPETRSWIEQQLDYK